MGWGGRGENTAARSSRGAYSSEVQQRTLTSASSGECPHPALAGTMAIRPALPLVRDEEAPLATTAKHRRQWRSVMLAEMQRAQ